VFKKFIAFVFAAIATVLFSIVGMLQASAHYTGIAPITCLYEDSCVIAYVDNGSLDGYYMARQENGTTWVRLTMVAGWDNDHVAPITCKYSTSCVLDWYGSGDGQPGDDYWMARQAAGSTWVRLTMVDGS
jgi:uncharacterized membrane protein